MRTKIEPRGKMPLGKSTRMSRRKDDNKMYLKGRGHEIVDWIELAQWRALVITIFNFLNVKCGMYLNQLIDY
jgi:hypothetical protein